MHLSQSQVMVNYSILQTQLYQEWKTSQCLTHRNSANGKSPQKEETNKTMSTAVFIQHDYQKSKKRRVSLTEDFDPRPVQFRGNAKSLLADLLEQVHGESLSISFLFDP